MINLGPCKTITNYLNILHVVNLTEYELSFNKISQAMDKIRRQTVLKEFLKISEQKLYELKKTLHLLLPTKRQKRGLMNGLGSAIKFITGNLDSTDAETIYQQLAKLEKTESNTQNLYTQSHILNIKMIERMQNITNYINNEQEHILFYLNNLSNKVFQETDLIKELQYISQINYNIDSLNNHLKEISEAIVLARLNIISKHILYEEEITEIRNMLEGENIRLISNEHMYNLLDLQAYYNNSNIIFNIKIPQVANYDCDFYNIFPLPINHTKKIIIKPYITHNIKEIQYFTTPCPKIENIYYCKQSSDRTETNQSTCIGAVFNNQPPKCHLDEIEMTPTIFQPREHFIFLINVLNTLIKHNCSKSNESIIEGTAIINFNNCTVEINGIVYADTSKTFWDNAEIILPPHPMIEVKSLTTSFKLPKLQEYNIKYNTSITTLQLKTQHQSIIAICTAGILICFIILAIILALRKKNSITYIPSVAPAISTSLWPSLWLGGGEVTCAPTTAHVTPTTT